MFNWMKVQGKCERKAAADKIASNKTKVVNAIEIDNVAT